MKTNRLTATKLRIILISTLITLIVLGALVFTYANKKLQAVAVEVSHTTVDAAASENNVSSLSMIEKLLEKQRDVVNKTSSIVADSQSYQYQNQIIDDLEGYAQRANISITNLDFGTSATSGTAATAPVAPAAGGVAGAPTAGAAAPSGVKATTVSITLVNPVDYKNLLTFINLIEQNLTKMQISKLSLSADAGAPGKVTSDALTIEVYVK